VSVDVGTTLGLAIIPPLVAIVFEAVNPIRGQFIDSSVERDLDDFRASIPADATPDHNDLIATVSGSTRASVEMAMLALTLMSVITSGFAIIHEFTEPYWPAIFYVIFFTFVGLILWKLLAGYSLSAIDETAAVTFRLWRWSRSVHRSEVLEFMIYLLNGLLIIFAFLGLGIPKSWVIFLKHYIPTGASEWVRPILFIGLGGLACTQIIAFMRSSQLRLRRRATLSGILAVIVMVISAQITERLENLPISISSERLGGADSSSEPGSLMTANIHGIETRLDSAGTTLSAMQKTTEGIETGLNSAGTTLSAMQKTMEAIETRLDSARASLSLIPKTLEAIDEQLLDLRIAQPVDLSYLTGTDCRRVQQTLKELAGYKGRIDGICDGATNAAAREWQMQERHTIAPGLSAEEIERTLRAPRGDSKSPP
jgi:hypothetical protein